MNELLRTVYGSHLYGTSTPSSDFDYKVVYLPPLEDVLLGRKLRTFKTREDAAGNPVSDTASMPDGGTEVEFVPFQTFCRDYLDGQTYALEVAQALVVKPCAPTWLKELVVHFTTCNVSSMAGFAMKQTFDHVHRGQRLAAAEKVLDVLGWWSATLDDLESAEPGGWTKKRLDTVMQDGRQLLDHVAEQTGLQLGTTFNNNRVLRTLKLNGREYLETTDLKQLELAVAKLVSSYGHRSTAAKEQEVDLKSLMHAVRVFQQAEELLLHGALTFPRSNAATLLAVKEGKLPLEQVKGQLLQLEERVQQLQEKSALLPQKTPELQQRFDYWLLVWLRKLYELPEQ